MALCGIIAALCLGSCLTLTDDLDLNKEISLDMQIGPGGLTIPVGSLDTLFLDSLIKIDGDESVLDTLGDGLYGISMDGEIEKVNVSIGDVTINIPKPDIDEISASFNEAELGDIVIDTTVQETSIQIQSIDLKTINNSLPNVKFEKFSTPVYDFNIPSFVVGKTIGSGIIPDIVIPEQAQEVSFSYTLPSDVESLDTVYFGDKNSVSGQKVTLMVDLAGIYALSNAPDITVKSLKVTFPHNFYLAKDDSLDKYVDATKVSVTDNVFSITDASITGVGDDHKLPVTLFIEKASFSEYGSDISYDEQIKYELELGLSFVCTESGPKQLYVSVDMPQEKLQMRNFSVSTKIKALSLPSGNVASSYEVTGLDQLSRVNYIDFDENQSVLNLFISDFDITPFEFDESSYIRLQFPVGFEFVKNSDNKVYVDNNAVGLWTDNTILDIWPGAAKGKTIQLYIRRLSILQNVDEVKKSIEVNNDVSYSGNISICAKTDLDTTALSILNDKDISFKVWGKLVVDNASVETSKIETSFNKTTTFSVDEEIDQALVELRSITLTKPAGASLQLHFKGIPETITKMTMENLKIVFPEFLVLKYDGNDPRVNLNANELVIDGDLHRYELDDDGDGFKLSGLKIVGMEFKDSKKIVDKRIKLDDSVSISGAVYVDNQTINSKDMKDLRVTPAVEFDPVVVKSIEGIVNPKIDAVHEEIDLDMGDDLDFFKNDENKLSLSDPQITININSTVTVPINLDLALSSKDSKGNLIADSITPDNGTIKLAKCDTTEQSRNLTIIIYKNERPLSQSDDTVLVRFSRLSELMSPIPDKIVFDLKASIDQNVESHYVDLTRELSVSGDYVVSVPLSFDSLYIEYSDTIKDLGESLEDIADKVEATELKIIADVESTIPLGITLNAQALDKNMNELNDIRIEPCVIAAGNDSITKSTMVLDVKVGKGSLGKLDAIVFTAACESGEGNSSIQKGQWLLIKKLSFHLPQGLKVDLTDMKDDKK